MANAILRMPLEKRNTWPVRRFPLERWGDGTLVEAQGWILLASAGSITLTAHRLPLIVVQKACQTLELFDTNSRDLPVDYDVRFTEPGEHQALWINVSRDAGGCHVCTLRTSHEYFPTGTPGPKPDLLLGLPWKFGMELLRLVGLPHRLKGPTTPPPRKPGQTRMASV